MAKLCVLSALLVAVALLGLSIFVYSPLHRDDPMSAAPCPFCQFQHLSAEPAVATVVILVAAPVVWIVTAELPALRWTSIPSARYGRAPPLSLFAA